MPPLLRDAPSIKQNSALSFTFVLADNGDYLGELAVTPDPGVSLPGTTLVFTCWKNGTLIGAITPTALVAQETAKSWYVTFAASVTDTLGELYITCTAPGATVARISRNVVAATASASDTYDILLNEIPGEYPEGTAGYVLGTNLDAKITSRAASGTFSAPVPQQSLVQQTTIQRVHGDKIPIYIAVPNETGITFTISATPTYAVCAEDGSFVLTASADGYDVGALYTPRAWVNLDTSVLVPGKYTLQIHIVAAGSGNSDLLPRAWDLVRTVVVANSVIPSASAAYYVDPDVTKGDDLHAGTKAAPFLTIDHALDQTDIRTLYLASGRTYDEMFTMPDDITILSFDNGTLGS